MLLIEINPINGFIINCIQSVLDPVKRELLDL